MQLHSTDRVNTDTKIPNSCQWQVRVCVCVHYSLTDYCQGQAAHGVSAQQLSSTLSPGGTNKSLPPPQKKLLTVFLKKKRKHIYSFERCIKLETTQNASFKIYYVTILPWNASKTSAVIYFLEFYALEACHYFPLANSVSYCCSQLRMCMSGSANQLKQILHRHIQS